jgi:hypothetical protein
VTTSSARAAARWGARLGLVLAIVAGVTGCSAYEQVFGKQEPKPCPRVAVLDDAAMLTQFRPGGGRDLIDVASEGEITGYKASCRYDVDDDTGAGTLAVDVATSFEVSRGPANVDRKAGFRYFIAVADADADADKRILSKQTFPVEVAFPGTVTRATYTDDPVTITIPLEAGNIGTDFDVFVGFQLTRAQMDYNRRRSGR